MTKDEREYEINWLMFNTRNNYSRDYYENLTDAAIQKYYDMMLSKDYQEN